MQKRRFQSQNAGFEMLVLVGVERALARRRGGAVA
jgi:hypothetical protein